MVIVSVSYPASAGSTFDLDYYREKHMPLVWSRWGALGLRRAELLRGTGAPGGGAAATHMVALLTFDSAEAFDRAWREHGREIMGDIRNFTNAKPAVQFNERSEQAGP